MKSNIEKLGDTLNKRMQTAAEARVGITAELGTITASMGLQVSSLGNVIPKGDYLISRDLDYGQTGSVLTHTASGEGTHGHGPSGEHEQPDGDGKHTHPSTEGAHTHSVILPSAMRSLSPGDRVLVVWCGNEPVVTDILVSS